MGETLFLFFEAFNSMLKFLYNNTKGNQMLKFGLKFLI